MATTLVKSFTHLKDRPNANRALHMLQRVASLVKPIMKKHSWSLPVLSEFYPDDPSLVGLNVNGGQKILLRLRLPHDSGSFYEEEQVVLVMLHELTHNVHGPHDDKFYKYLSGLESEWDALKSSGYSGEGFLSDGHRLGTNVSHNIAPHQARAKALEAAEKRRKVSSLMGRGGRLGGGDSMARNLSPRELAARAAERRARDAKACASGADAEREAVKAALESIASEAIDLTGDSDNEVIIVDGPGSLIGPPNVALRVSHGRTNAGTHVARDTHLNNSNDAIVVDDTRAPTPGPSSSKEATSEATIASSRDGSVTNTLSTRSTTRTQTAGSTIQSKNRPSVPARASDQIPSDWACPICTLLNPMNALQCDACLTVRPTDDAEGWRCRVCGEYPMPHDFWTCRFCGTVKAN